MQILILQTTPNTHWILRETIGFSQNNWWSRFNYLKPAVFMQALLELISSQWAINF